MLWPYPSLKKKKRKKKKYIFSSSYLVKQGMKGRTPRYAAIQLWVLWGTQCRTSENLDSLLTRSWSACIKVTGAPGGLVSQHQTGPIPLHCTPANNPTQCQSLDCCLLHVFPYWGLPLAWQPSLYTSSSPACSCHHLGAKVQRSTQETLLISTDSFQVCAGVSASPLSASVVWRYLP